jgi:hypothetical protein
MSRTIGLRTSLASETVLYHTRTRFKQGLLGDFQTLLIVDTSERPRGKCHPMCHVGRSGILQFDSRLLESVLRKHRFLLPEVSLAHVQKREASQYAGNCDYPTERKF